MAGPAAGVGVLVLGMELVQTVGDQTLAVDVLRQNVPVLGLAYLGEVRSSCEAVGHHGQPY